MRTNRVWPSSNIFSRDHRHRSSRWDPQRLTHTSLKPVVTTGKDAIVKLHSAHCCEHTHRRCAVTNGNGAMVRQHGESTFM